MRIAILDLGTNTFHLLIVDAGSDGVFKKVFKSKLVVKLGAGAIHKNYISEIPFRRGKKALAHYRQVMVRHEVDRSFAFATSAIRSASNGPEFVKQISEEIGIDIQVISGDEEAELICLGVRQCLELGDKPSLILDIGGGSTEFIIANNSQIFWKQSFNIGAARLLEMFKPSDPVTEIEVKALEEFLDQMLAPLVPKMEELNVQSLAGSSGSFDTFAEMIGYLYHGRNVIKNADHYRFNLEEYFQLHEILLRSTSAERMEMKGLIKMRVDMIVLASICTNFVLRKFRIQEMQLSKYALKEGALWKIMNAEKQV
jgi:exopolyphosphatase / guanosine-5'-triphosphate,3'-diphosphate pyrophosphatase